MYQEFTLNNREFPIMGYLWRAVNPKKVILIIHGIGEHGGLYDRMGQAFSKNDFTAAAIDLRGHGCTPGRRGHTAPRGDVLKDVDSLILCAKKNCPGVPLVLMGHSMGGNIILDYRNRGTYSEEISAYVACSPWLMLKKKLPIRLKGFLNAISKVRPDKQLSAGIKPKYLGNPNIIEKRKNRPLGHNTITLETAADNFNIGYELMTGTAAVSEKNGRSRPFLLMHGSQDQICSVEGSRKLAELEKERITYVEWKGYFHELHNGNSEMDGSEVIDYMISWIKGIM